MNELVDRIQDLIAAPGGDLDVLERTLTDGYAAALTLEAEQLRLERRINEMAHGIQRGDTAGKARELSALSEQLDVKGDDLTRLRDLLGDLRRQTELVRVAEVSR